MAGGDGGHRLLRGLQATLTSKGQICTSETLGVMDCNTVNTECQPDQFDYYYMNLEASTVYTIEVDRVSCGMDPALAIFEGSGSTFPSGCFGYDGSADLAWIADADDNSPEPAYCSEDSPFADPILFVTPSTSGPFTLAVLNYLSDSSSCIDGYQYKVKINPPPSCFSITCVDTAAPVRAGDAIPTIVATSSGTASIVEGPASSATAGLITVTATASDGNGNTATCSVVVPVYDPSEGFVTGK